MYDISVIIPTHNKVDMVCRNITVLANQTLPPSQFEVIVVADGCDDQTAEALKSLDLPFRLRVIEQPAAGAAKARNAGADLAEGSLLVFLDDDMSADPGLLQVHWQTQSTEASLLVGFFTAPSSYRSGHPLAAFVNEWWDGRFQRLSLSGNRYNFQDVCTGHMSVFRSAFLDTGGFDNEIGRRAGEDYEFGIRWLKSGRPIRYSPAARSQHLDSPVTGKALKRAYNEGRGHVLMARRHPECFMLLPLQVAFDGQPRLYIRRWWRLSPRKARLISLLVEPAVHLAGALKLRRTFSHLHTTARLAHYWAGVLHETDGLEGFRQLIQDIPYQASNSDFVEIDIAGAPEVLARQFAELEPRSVGVVARGEPLTWIDNIPGSGPIDWAQVLRELEHSLEPSLLSELPPLESYGSGPELVRGDK